MIDHSPMRFVTKLIEHDGKFMIKLPKKLSSLLGIKPGDQYTTTLLPDGGILVKFPHRLSPLNTS